MKMSKHTPGLWKLEAAYPACDWQRSIFSERGNVPVNMNVPADNAARIVECVNALEGVENPTAVKQLLELATYLWHPDNRNPNIYEAMQMAQRALAALGVK